MSANGEPPSGAAVNNSKPVNELGDGATTAQTSATSENGLDLTELVIETKDLTFTYAPKRGNLLNKINLTFPKSAIYGFLGPSGCGKTTMIKLIMGQLKPVSGSIRINGKPVCDPSNKIPGAGVGYMPQEIALYRELTIKETLNYFARIYGLPSDYKKKRMDFLIKFLELPDPNRLVGVLSGGQQRRTSLAVALIHNPKLLILDEPTVGVDPMLRERIWKHLMYLSAEEKISIMITTHYIEECHRAHVIALMRGGKLLVENTPKVLLKHFQTNNLEEVFLEVCKGEEQQTRQARPPNLSQVRKDMTTTKKSTVAKNSSSDSFKSTFCGRYLALLQKNVSKLWRQKLYIFALLITPLITTVLLCTTFGSKPKNLEVAVYNLEKLTQSSKYNFSEELLSRIDSKTIKLIDFKTNESAQDSVREGHTFGALIIHQNFSDELFTRVLSILGSPVSDETIRQSTIQFYADTTDFMIFQALYQTLRKAEFDFERYLVKKYGRTMGVNPKGIEPIISLVDPPIYGTLDPVFRDFATGGMLIIAVYIFSMAATTLDIIGERMERTLDRSLVAGVKMLEMLLALITVQLIILVMQSISMTLLVFYVFEIRNVGNYGLIIAIMICQGLQGMACGLFISIISYDELMGLELLVGVFMPFLIISGIIWPIEGMHYILRIISLFTPQTLPTLALRNIMLKGWGLEHTLVWAGFAASFGFFVFFIILVIIASSIIQL